MVGHRLRVLTMVLLAVILMTGGTWLSSVLGDKTPWCTITSEWARVHARELPKNLAEFQTIPRAYRGPVWTIMSPEARCQVMRSTFEAAIESGRLTAQQVTLLEDALTDLTPEFYVKADKFNAVLWDGLRTNGTAVPHDPADPWVQRVTEVAQRFSEAFRPGDPNLKLVSPFRLPQMFPRQVSLLLPVLRGFIRSIGSQAAAASSGGGQCSCGADYWILSDCERNMGYCSQAGWSCNLTTCSGVNSCAYAGYYACWKACKDNADPE